MEHERNSRTEVILAIGLLVIVFGILVGADVFWRILDDDLGIWIVVVGVWIVCGYVTKKLLPNKTGSFLLGFLLGLLGVVVALCIKPPSEPKTANNSNKYDDLKKIAELKQSGVLSDEEFEIEKSKILK